MQTSAWAALYVTILSLVLTTMKSDKMIRAECTGLIPILLMLLHSPNMYFLVLYFGMHYLSKTICTNTHVWFLLTSQA